MGIKLDELPEPVIQHILSFLTGEEAARTTLLSKSWRKAWLTRPNLAFEGAYYYNVWKLATKTIQRYQESNLKIRSLTLRVSCGHRDEIDICNELIATSLKLGATHLNLDTQSYCTGSEKSLVFGSSSGLESLCLKSTSISLDTLSNTLSSNCPSIRTLSLSHVRAVEEEQGVNRWVVGLGQINLGSLTRLELVYVYFDTLFLDDLSSRFPSLTDFTLHRFSNNSSSSKGNNKVIRISSRSLLRLNFAQLREWESRVSIVRRRNLATSWFRGLSEFLKKLRRSKLHVSLEFEGRWACFDYEVGEIEGLSSSRRARVEDLTVELGQIANLNCYALFDGLFQVCRPKVITQYLRPLVESRAGRKVNSTFSLCKAFLAREEGHFLYCGLRDLEEVNAEILDDEGVWRHVPLKSLLDIRWEKSWDTEEEEEDEEQDRSHFERNIRFEQCIRLEQKIRFQLKWKRRTHGSAHL